MPYFYYSSRYIVVHNHDRGVYIDLFLYSFCLFFVYNSHLIQEYWNSELASAKKTQAWLQKVCAKTTEKLKSNASNWLPSIWRRRRSRRKKRLSDCFIWWIVHCRCYCFLVCTPPKRCSRGKTVRIGFSKSSQHGQWIIRFYDGANLFYRYLLNLLTDITVFLLLCFALQNICE
jgi:hypothetical protein